MNIDEIIYKVNHFTMDQLVPFKETDNQKIYDECEKKGCIVKYRYEEWKELFPEIPADKVFLACGLGITGYIYYDKEKYIFLDLGIVYGHDMYEGKKGMREDRIKELERKYEERDYDYLLNMAPSGVRMFLAGEMIANEAPSPELSRAFFSSYCTTDYGFYNLKAETFEKAASGRNAAQKKEVRKKLESYPEKITVYRGEANMSTSYEHAYSWTTDISIAYFFACRLGDSSRIIKAEINKEDVIDIGRDDEFELLVLPGKISNVEITELLSANDVLKDTEKLRRFLSFFNFHKSIVSAVYRENNRIDGHDKMHSVRVLFLALLIAENEKLTKKEKEILCTAIDYHDAGRVDEYENPEHGAASREIFLKKNPENIDIEFLVKYHCLDDEVAEKVFERNKEKFMSKDIMKLYAIMKDADALDRVRFGIKALDADYLRLEYSRRLVKVAVDAERDLKDTV